MGYSFGRCRAPCVADEEAPANFMIHGAEFCARTVSKYLPKRPTGRPRGDMCWSTFLRLHAQGIIACDFFLAVTATFRLLYVLVVIEHRSRRLVHCNVTVHPLDLFIQCGIYVAGVREAHFVLVRRSTELVKNNADEGFRYQVERPCPRKRL